MLPRDWDGHRLLRFLAGLAMLALAFSAPAMPAVAAEPVAIVSMAETVDETPVTLSESAPATSEVRATAAGVLPEGLPVLAVAVFAVVLTGLAQRVRIPRAPPAV
ncbi:hypothetical protein Ari01nite_03250 [Paractinoplanes rishiriensis]|uniref:Uncharacterized protein n=1 Tax=Paractinoplanes rishiriensis TaxID=1050105 RepID=A0A919JSF7_9ACTN|nr:hypothetical protein Ari01nite_03250 [Actinoplanes rishiriensis]